MNRKLRIFLFILIIVAVLSTCEGIVRVVIRSDWIINTTSELTDYHWVLLWAKNPSHHGLNQPIFEYHKVLGWVPKPGSTTSFENGANVHINSFGFRGVHDPEKNIPTGKKRAILLGDSFTFGDGVEDDQTYGSVIESIYPDFEILNAGVSGYGIDQMYLRYLDIGSTIDHDLVIMAFIYDDLVRTSLSFRDYAKPKFELTENGLIITNVPVPDVTSVSRTFNHQLHLVHLIRLINERISVKLIKEEFNKDVINNIWEKLTVRAAENGAAVVLVYLPTGDEIINADEPYIFTKTAEELMNSFCEQRSLYCRSLRPRLLEEYSRNPQLDTKGHYSPSLHRIVADVFIDILKKTGYL